MALGVQLGWDRVARLPPILSAVVFRGNWEIRRWNKQGDGTRQSTAMVQFASATCFLSGSASAA
jgi:hypothetical protein